MVESWIVLLQIEDDAYQEDLGFSLGQLGKSGSGRVRQAQVNEATKARISKSLQVSAILAWTVCCVFQLLKSLYNLVAHNRERCRNRAWHTEASPRSETAPQEPAPAWPSLLCRSEQKLHNWASFHQTSTASSDSGSNGCAHVCRG